MKRTVVNRYPAAGVILDPVAPCGWCDDSLQIRGMRVKVGSELPAEDYMGVRDSRAKIFGGAQVVKIAPGKSGFERTELIAADIEGGCVAVEFNKDRARHFVVLL